MSAESAAGREAVTGTPDAHERQRLEEHRVRGRPQTARAIVALWAACLWALTLSSTCLAATVEVTRRLSVVDVRPGSAFEMALDVKVGDSPPSGLVIEEHLPEGWTVEESTWSGSRAPLGPVANDDAHKWLFDPLGEPVAAGTLTVRVVVPAGAEPDNHTLGGVAKWFDRGTEVERATGGAEVVEVLDHIAFRVERDWCLLSLPFELELPTHMRQAFAVAGEGTVARGVLSTWDPAAGDYVRGTWLPEATRGFWVLCDAGGATPTLYGTKVGNHLTLPAGWNLVGPPQATLCDELFDDYGAIAVWGWDAVDQSFFRLHRGGFLERGKAYWVYLPGEAPPARALPR